MRIVCSWYCCPSIYRYSSVYSCYSVNSESITRWSYSDSYICSIVLHYRICNSWWSCESRNVSGCSCTSYRSSWRRYCWWTKTIITVTVTVLVCSDCSSNIYLKTWSICCSSKSDSRSIIVELRLSESSSVSSSPFQNVIICSYWSTKGFQNYVWNVSSTIKYIWKYVSNPSFRFWYSGRKSYLGSLDYSYLISQILPLGRIVVYISKSNRTNK